MRALQLEFNAPERGCCQSSSGQDRRHASSDGRDVLSLMIRSQQLNLAYSIMQLQANRDRGTQCCVLMKLLAASR